MARTISADALDVIATGARYRTKASITLPDDPPDQVPIGVNIAKGWDVSEKGPIAGPRLSVSELKILPTDGVDDLFELAGYPGAVYDLSIGIVLGATTEWVQVFSGYVNEGSSQRLRLGVPTSLSDGWTWADRVPIVGQFVTVADVSRAATILDLMTPPAVGFETRVDDVGGYITTPGIYTGSRGQAAAALASDGLLQAGFNGEGTLVVKAQPDLSAGLPTPDWLFRTDQDPSLPVAAAPSYPATIIAGTLERTRPWAEALYNAVTVKPGGSGQTWAEQTVTLSNTLDKRHPDKIGYRPFEITSDTIDNACDAWLLAGRTLNRLLRGTDEKVRLQVLLNPAIEKDDVFFVAALPTLEDSGWNGTYIATDVTHSPEGAVTSIEGVSARGYEFD